MPAQSLGTSSKTLAHWLLGLEPELSWKLEMQNRFFYYLFTYFYLAFWLVQWQGTVTGLQCGLLSATLSASSHAGHQEEPSKAKSQYWMPSGEDVQSWFLSP